MFTVENTRILLVYAIYGFNPEAYRLALTSGINNQVVNP
jgi:hypothetical protein